MLNRLKEKIIFLGLSIKKEILIFTVINLLLGSIFVPLIIFNVSVLVIIIVASFIPVIDYLYLSRYNTMIKRMKDNRNSEFISLLSYFELFISNHNNVYKSFESIIPYCSDWMQEKVDNMLKEIDQDKSVAPFVNFANNFEYLVIQNVMISIYQMVDQGESQQMLSQFDHLFTSLSDNLFSEKIESKTKSLDTLNAFPLLGAGLITIILTFSIMSILGDITSVI